jgi:hypothetical protein
VGHGPRIDHRACMHIRHTGGRRHSDTLIIHQKESFISRNRSSVG